MLAAVSWITVSLISFVFSSLLIFIYSRWISVSFAIKTISFFQMDLTFKLKFASLYHFLQNLYFRIFFRDSSIGLSFNFLLWWLMLTNDSFQFFLLFLKFLNYRLMRGDFLVLALDLSFHFLQIQKEIFHFLFQNIFLLQWSFELFLQSISPVLLFLYFLFLFSLHLVLLLPLPLNHIFYLFLHFLYCPLRIHLFIIQ